MKLRGEMDGLIAALQLRHCQRLAALGVRDWPAMTQDGLLGMTRASVGPDDLWTPDDAGQPHVCVAVVEDGAIVDIVAFRPDQPDAWALRTGNGWALGVDNVQAARSGWTEEQWTLHLHATPLDWLRASCIGACVIDGFSFQASAEIRDCKALKVDDARFARALRLQLSKPLRLPEIAVTRGARHAA